MRQVLAISLLFAFAHHAVAADEPAALKPASQFASIPDADERSSALFREAGRVLQSPRCLNCHPVSRQPTQGEDLHAHVPLMQAGLANHGPAGLPCASCHGPANVPTHSETMKSVPGDPHWSLAPASMAWQGKSLREICIQIKDTARNGGRSLAQIHEHMAKDHLVGWAWRPGEGRAPAPGTQASFGALIKAWIDSGASCPTS